MTLLILYGNQGRAALGSPRTQATDCESAFHSGCGSVFLVDQTRNAIKNNERESKGAIYIYNKITYNPLRLNMGKTPQVRAHPP